VKLYDDLMAATRYAVMMLREAKTLEPPTAIRDELWAKVGDGIRR
jgi:hypothetical protein